MTKTRYAVRRTRLAQQSPGPFGLRPYDKFVAALPSPREVVETDFLDEARTFSSTLGAVTMMMTHEPYMTGEGRHDWEVVDVAQCRARPRPYEPPFALARPCPVAAAEEIAVAHGHYCERIEGWLRRAGVPDDDMRQGRPTAELVMSAPRWAGIYDPASHTCSYPVAYALMAEDYMRLVVAHECVHAYMLAFCGKVTEGHGSAFYALMLRAAREPVSTHTHPYDTKVAAELAEHLRPWLLRQLELGLLAGLPLSVDTDSLTRPRSTAAVE